jgi:hypothetical protein
MTAQIYQMRDYQATEARLRLLRNQVEQTTRDLAAISMGFCINLDTAPSEMNPDDGA